MADAIPYSRNCPVSASPQLARSHLLYGEWLCRRNRPLRYAHLRTAYDMLSGMGAEALAEPTRREVLATGETARKRAVDTVSKLTAWDDTDELVRARCGHLLSGGSSVSRARRRPCLLTPQLGDGQGEPSHSGGPNIPRPGPAG